MDLWHSTPFGIYALFATGLCLLLLGIDSAGGVTRVKTKLVVNAEDATTVAKGAGVAASDPEAVARVMRAHRNALANVIPFLVVMFLYVALGATSTWVLALCGAFSLGRVVHAFAYINAKQPLRTISFLVGQLCILVAAIQVVRAAISIVM